MKQFARTKTSGGFAVLDAMLWMVIVSMGLVIRSTIDSNTSGLAQSGQYGKEIREINSALQELLSTNPNFPDGLYEDLSILRSTECATPGLADDHYLPCDATLETLKVGPLLNGIVVTSTASAVLNVDIKISNATFGPFTSRDGQLDPTIAGQVAASANGYIINAHSPIVASVRSFYGVDFDASTVVATNTANPATDTWARTDGGNEFNANFTFSLDDAGNPRSDVVNARSVISQTFVDWDDATRFVDPSGQSVIGGLDVNDSLRIVGDGAIVNEGNDLRLIAPNNSVSITSSDVIALNVGPNPEDRVVVTGSGLIQADDIYVTEKSTNIPISELLPSIVLKAVFIANHDDRIPYIREDGSSICEMGSEPRIVIAAGRRISIDQDSPPEKDWAPTREKRAMGVAHAVDDGYSFLIQYINAMTGEPLDEQRVVNFYCDFAGVL